MDRMKTPLIGRSSRMFRRTQGNVKKKEEKKQKPKKRTQNENGTNRHSNTKKNPPPRTIDRHDYIDKQRHKICLKSVLLIS